MHYSRAFFSISVSYINTMYLIHKIFFCQYRIRLISPSNIVNLEDIIIENFKGKREKNREYKQTIITPKYNPSEDTDLESIKLKVEEAIDLFIDEFIDIPYLHRVEHSIHTQLFHIMMGIPDLSQQIFLGDDKTKTLLVHKE